VDLTISILHRAIEVRVSTLEELEEHLRLAEAIRKVDVTGRGICDDASRYPNWRGAT